MWALYVTTLCEHSMCDHSMWALYGSTLCEHSMRDHSMLTLYVSTLCVTSLCEHSMCDQSMWTLYGSTLYVSTLCVTTLCEHSMCDHSIWAHRKVRKLPGKMNISSWAGCCRTPKSTKITRKHRLQFLGRMLQRQKRQKSPSFIVKTPVKSIAEHRKVRELPRKMNIEEVEEAKKYENLQTKPVLDPFKSTAPHRKVRELPRKMNIEEVEEPETMKIYRQNPFTPVWATRKLRKFTDETNMQARNHENSDEICVQLVRHLDLATPAFYTYRKNPKCYHTVWGITGVWTILSLYVQTSHVIFSTSRSHIAGRFFPPNKKKCFFRAVCTNSQSIPGFHVHVRYFPRENARGICIVHESEIRAIADGVVSQFLHMWSHGMFLESPASPGDPQRWCFCNQTNRIHVFLCGKPSTCFFFVSIFLHMYRSKVMTHRTSFFCWASLSEVPEGFDKLLTKMCRWHFDCNVVKIFRVTPRHNRSLGLTHILRHQNNRRYVCFVCGGSCIIWSHQTIVKTVLQPKDSEIIGILNNSL